MFTSALAEGLRTGAADPDGDGYVSVEDAYEYAYRKVIAVTQVKSRNARYLREKVTCFWPATRRV